MNRLFWFVFLLVLGPSSTNNNKLSAAVLVRAQPTMTTISTDINSIPSAQDFAEVARISGSVYVASSVDSSALLNDGTTTPLAFIDKGGVQVAVLLSITQRIYIVFRGTDGENADFAFNRQASLVEFTEIGMSTVETMPRVFKGFYESLFSNQDESLLIDLDNAVLQAASDYPEHEIMCIGHSLGGAQSILYAVYLARAVLQDRKIRSYSIGTPRVGDEAFQTLVDKDTPNLMIWRLVNQNDIIARSPLKNLSYRHVGSLLLYKNGGSSVQGYFQQNGDDATYSGVPSSSWNIEYSLDDILSPLVDHFWWNYQQVMDRVLRGEISWPSEFEKVQRSPARKNCRYWFVLCWRD